MNKRIIVRYIKDLYFSFSHLRIKSKEIIPDCLSILKKTKKRKIIILKAFYNDIQIDERKKLFYHISSIIIDMLNPKFNIIKVKHNIETLKKEIFKPRLTQYNNEDFLDNNLNIEEEEEYNNDISQNEDYPFRIIGDIQKKGNVFGLFNYRYAEIDVAKGLFKRYQSPKNYPNKPLEVFNFKDIIKIKTLPKTQKDTFYYMEIKYKPNDGKEKTQLYRTRHMISRENWYNYISKVFRHFKKNEDLPPINRNKLIFIDDQVGVVQEILKGDGKKKKKKITLDDFHIISKLGAGAFGTVYKVKSKLDKKEYALKVINKNTIIEKKYFYYMMQEYKILKLLNGCPFILGLHYAFPSANYLFMVVDICSNGDISNAQMIINPKLLIAELILSIEYMHNKKVIYRDLKAENILLNSEGHIKICDFNLSKMNVGENDRALSFCGSPLYLSPEMLERKGVNFKADIYQVGLLIYEILVGRTAYKANKLEILYDNIIHNRINFNVKELNNETRDLLKKILKKNPEKRLTLKQIKEHKYFSDINWKDVYNKRCGNIQVIKKGQRRVEGDYEYERNRLKAIEMVLDYNPKYTILNGKVTWKEIKKDIQRPMRNFVKEYYYEKVEEKEEMEEDDKEDEINTDTKKLYKKTNEFHNYEYNNY